MSMKATMKLNSYTCMQHSTVLITISCYFDAAKPGKKFIVDTPACEQPISYVTRLPGAQDD